ncbi:hypothetical protein ID866_7779, partial [Astraeus odoratus]
PGVGKTSLINHTFGIDEAYAEYNQRGVEDIETELLSPLNDGFVLHDSRRFESENGKAFNAVEQFIRRCKDHPDIKEQLHAIW